MSDFANIISEAQTSFINELDQRKREISGILEFHQGSSSAFQNLTVQLQQKIRPFIEDTLNKLISVSQDNIRLSFEKQNYQRKSSLIQENYQAVTDFFQQFTQNYSKLWGATSFLASSLVQSHDNLRDLYSKYTEVYKVATQLSNRVHQLESSLVTANARTEWFLNEMKPCFQADGLIKNTEKSLAILCNAADERLQKKIIDQDLTIKQLTEDLRHKESEISQLTTKNALELEKVNHDNEALRNKIMLLEAEKQVHIQDISLKNTEIQKMEKVITSTDLLEKSIHKFCEVFPFVHLGDEGFSFRPDKITADDVLKFSLETLNEQKKSIESELGLLKQKLNENQNSHNKELSSLSQKYQDEIRALKSSQNSLHLSLQGLSKEKFELQSKNSILSLDLDTLNKQVQTLQQQVMDLKKHNKESMSCEQKLSTEYANLMQKISSAQKYNTATQPPLLSMHSDVNSALKESNELLHKENAILKSKLERFEKEHQIGLHPISHQTVSQLEISLEMERKKHQESMEREKKIQTQYEFLKSKLILMQSQSKLLEAEKQLLSNVPVVDQPPSNEVRNEEEEQND